MAKIVGITNNTNEHKKIEEKVLGKWENAYLTIKNTKTSRTLKWALDPGFPNSTWLHQQSLRKNFWEPLPLDQILDRLL